MRGLTCIPPNKHASARNATASLGVQAPPAPSSRRLASPQKLVLSRRLAAASADAGTSLEPIKQQQLSQGEDAVAAALSAAQASLQAAEDGLDKVPHLPSARDPRQAEAMRKLVTRFQLALVIGAVIISHRFGALAQLASGLVAALCIGGWGIGKGSLSLSGAIAAVAVGLGTLGSSFRFGAVLLAFFFSGSKLTAWKEEKKQVDEEFKKGGQRDWRQVFCNGLIPALLAVGHGWLTGLRDVPLGGGLEARAITLLSGAFLGYFACCCGDTWASELGQLSEDTPRLITTGRPVQKGTNGGVTLLGMGASVAGGMFTGLVFWACGALSPSLGGPGLQGVAFRQWQLIPLGLAAGLLGSVLDSVLGATVQFTGYNRVTRRITGRPGADVFHISGYPLLDNNLVNLVSATTTAAATAWAALQLFP